MHAHAQIYYKGIESLIGFNPAYPEDRETCHEMLDEYLDRMQAFMEELKAEGKTSGKEEAAEDSMNAGFHIWPHVD